MRKIASFISTIGHPLLTIPVFIVIVMFSTEAFATAALVSGLLICGVFIPVTLWAYLKSRNGSYTNFDVSDKKQRRSLFWFSVPLLTVATIVLFATNQSENFCISVLFALILLVVTQGVNFFVKSSLHVSFSIYLSSLIFMLNDKCCIAALVFTGLISWSRIKLGRHTLTEVLFGLLIGGLISLLMLRIEGYLELF